MTKIPTSRQVALCFGVTAYLLTAVLTPAQAVLCLGPNGHIAIEPEHNGCCAHVRQTSAVQMKPAAGVFLQCCCIDILLPTQERPCTVDLHEPDGYPGRPETPCAQSIDAVLRIMPLPSEPFDEADLPTATVVLLI